MSNDKAPRGNLPFPTEQDWDFAITALQRELTEALARIEAAEKALRQIVNSPSIGMAHDIAHAALEAKP